MALRRNAPKAPRAGSPASAVALFGVVAVALDSLRAMGIVIGSTTTFAEIGRANMLEGVVITGLLSRWTDRSV